MTRKEATPADAGAPNGGKNKLKLILLVVVGSLLTIGLSVGGTWLFLSKSLKTEKIGEVASEAAEPGRQSAFYEILTPASVVNFNQNGRQCYTQVGVALMGRDKAQMGASRKHMPLVCNKLVMLFSSQSFDSLVTSVDRETLRQQATVGLQELVKKETGQLATEQVLFINPVLQQVSHGRARSASPE